MTALDLHTRPAEYSVLELALPGRPPAPFGVLLLDLTTGELHCREDAATLASPEDAEVLAQMAEEIESRAKESGGRELLERLEDTLSNVLLIGERTSVSVRDFRYTLDRLFDTHILGRQEERKTLPFVTHLPVYSLRAAAGKFGEDMEVEEEAWAEAPPDLNLTRDMFAVHVTGRSMLPLIPDGSLAVFRYAPAGSRQGKRVLVWRRASAQDGGEFTVKVYESQKTVTEEGWQHTRIRLKPLNPEYEVLDLEDETEYRILGEFVCLLPEIG
jgi:SOS-response transcriptional repressor LexA